MRTRVIPLCLACAGIVACVSCARKESPAQKPNELTPGNALEQYGGVMGNALKRAKEMDILMPLQHSISSFRATEGRNPSSLEELAEKGYELPKPPEGKKFTYNPSTGTVGIQ